jgi:lipoyl(octanoyl) transferase
METIVCEGLSPYAEVYARMIARRDAVARGEAGNALYLVEHTPVITLGRDWAPEHLLHSQANLAKLGVEVVQAGRGGGVTYHGPGQLVAYPVLNLHEWRTSVGWYLRALEQVLIGVCDSYGLEGERLEGYTGVWVGGAKVAAVGVGLRHWVTCHGIALNIDPDMNHFGYIIPCGIADKPVTSLARLLGTPPPFQEVRERFQDTFLRHFA